MRETLPSVRCSVCRRTFSRDRIELDISTLRNGQSQCTNNRVQYSVLPVGSGSGVRAVSLCTIVK